jgi:hypothetical protein
VSRTAGRRPTSRGIFAIEAQALLLPDPVGLDTSLVVEALIASQPLHAACRAFLIRLTESGTAMVTSDLLPVELAEAVFAIALKERWGPRIREQASGASARPPVRPPASPGCDLPL